MFTGRRGPCSRFPPPNTQSIISPRNTTFHIFNNSLHLSHVRRLLGDTERKANNAIRLIRQSPTAPRSLATPTAAPCATFRSALNETHDHIKSPTFPCVSPCWQYNPEATIWVEVRSNPRTSHNGSPRLRIRTSSDGAEWFLHFIPKHKARPFVNGRGFKKTRRAASLTKGR